MKQKAAEKLQKIGARFYRVGLNIGRIHRVGTQRETTISDVDVTAGPGEAPENVYPPKTFILAPKSAIFWYLA